MPDLNRLEAYDYDLPHELIAQYPLPDRSSSRLMRVCRASGRISHHCFTDITRFLHPREVLVLNNSAVIPARLFGTKSNGTKIEVLLLHKVNETRWKCMVHPGKRLKHEQYLDFSASLRGLISLPDPDGLREIEMETKGDFWTELSKAGHVPLPPYIKRPDESSDCNTYQTVYASEKGSVAAPTAGLHFTPELLHQIQEKGVTVCYVTLHVGIGTFLPVKTNDITRHKMHSEFCTVPQETADAVNSALLDGRRIISVGSTSTRTLESFYHEGYVTHGSRWTDIYIYPGRQIEVVKAMITNFHLPKSSLLMMISAFAGYDIVREAYAEAIANAYRFFSYGDAMLIE
jgi:S-adenosylmethionine:tRNA ribosyltransferase-isomerase